MKMQRVIVAETHRGMNIGSEMMAFCEKFAIDRKSKLIYCHARDSAVNFYTKNGFIGIGDYFDEDGIPHLNMRKKL
jgi:predicted GNAT family N-acyltransferase